MPEGESLSGEAFLREFGASDGVLLGLDLLRDAAERRDETDVAMALIVCFTFGFVSQHLDLLIDLAFADWHKSHEDVASALGDFRSPAAVDALVHLVEWVPSYSDWDEARALAVKAVWALGAIPDARARRALEQFVIADSSPVARAARHQFKL